MAIRSFEGECWICGWFDDDGKLIDIQQYDTEDMALRTARSVRPCHGGHLWPFVGKLEDYADVIQPRLEAAKS